VVWTSDLLVILVAISSKPLELKLVILCSGMKYLIGFSVILKREIERSLFAISVTTNTITISHNGRLPERKTPSQLATYDNYNQ